MRHLVTATLLLFLSIGTCSHHALAREAKPFGLAMFGSCQRYDMSDVDDAIDTPGTFFPGATARADKIEGGAGFGAGFRVWPSQHVRVGFDVARLLAKTQGSGIFSSTAYEGELSVPATAVAATVSYHFRPFGRCRPGLGVGAGYYLCAGTASATMAGSTYEADVDGSGFGFHGEADFDLSLTRAVHAEIGAGYRHAATTDVEVRGAVLRNADGSKSKVDWSGVWGRAGLTLYLGRGAS